MTSIPIVPDFARATRVTDNLTPAGCIRPGSRASSALDGLQTQHGQVVLYWWVGGDGDRNYYHPLNI